MTDVVWPDSPVIRLVKEYKNRPILWDPNHNYFRAHMPKREAYLALAETFKWKVVDVKKKLTSILASYRREKAKIRLGGKSNWFLYPYMNFLPNHLENNEHEKRKHPKKQVVSDEDEEEEEEAESEHSYDENGVAEEIIIKEEPMSVIVQEPSKVQQKFSPQKPRLTRVLRRKLVKGLRQEPNTSSIVLDTMKLIKKSDLMRKKDECDSFGEYIAVSLRKHDQRTQAMIKQAINNILFEQEMTKCEYNPSQYTVVVSGMEQNPLMDHESEK